MIQLQILNYVLASKSLSILQDNNIGKEYFTEYPDEIEFIENHYSEYKKIPDMETFVAKFPDFEPIEVTESERYLVDTIREEYLYSKSVPVIKHAAELLKQDANVASQYLQSELPNLTPNYTTPYVDIIHNKNRIDVFNQKSENKDSWFISTGFEELDDLIGGGWQMGEEFGVIFARTGQGKSWVTVKFAQHAWEIGKNVGYISPEMSADRIGYRFDTLNGNLSNTALIRGDTETVSESDYESYYDTLSKRENKFLVSTPLDFNKQITVSKLRTFIQANKLDLLAIDGITYMTDERYKRGDNKTTTLTNISEDLMSLSCEMHIPILAVVQSNRGGIKEDANATPALEDIRDSDGIAHNATKVISLRQKDEGLIMELKKNRDGAVGKKLTYLWDIDLGTFTWIPSDDDDIPEERKEEKKKELKENTKDIDKKIVF